MEGKYYVWSQEEVAKVAGPEAARSGCPAALGGSPAGNFEGANILTRPLSRAEWATRFQLAPKKVGQVLAAAFDRLNQVRAQRLPTGDKKGHRRRTGLAITALALGAQVLGDAIPRPRPMPVPTWRTG